MMTKLVQFIIGFVALYLIFTYLVPMLSGIIHIVVVIVLVLVAIIWLLRLANIT